MIVRPSCAKSRILNARTSYRIAVVMCKVCELLIVMFADLIGLIQQAFDMFFGF